MHAIQNVTNCSSTNGASNATPPPRLVRAAHEFEAQMLKELLQPMTGDSTLTGGDAGANSTLKEFASEALGRALSQGGGFGIANRIVHDLSHSGPQCQTVEVTENHHDDTVISTPKSLK